MKPGELIKKARDQAGLTQAALAARLDHSEKTVRNWEDGSTPLNAARLIKAARALGFDSWDELKISLGGAIPFSARLPPDKLIPLFDEVPAGNGDFDPTNYGEDNGYSGVMLDPAMFGNISDPLAYAVKVKGDSMLPEFAEGEIVVCSPGAEKTPGMYGVFRLDDGDCGIKVIEEGSEPGMVRLTPLNRRHPTREVSEESITRLAKVICKTTVYR